ncbi:hypothetical protein [Criblamydia sequanensis]|uniref:Membrane protein n=1 Tax=Candidatus Criblamydia sequanensis CRIB-18 TaxID=1437425 RepID=A0A090CYC8_9BACT|nr:hypothetical protein [Criblamydia sequanensis]CDR33311.1 putative membrane protein [Criblamydia sequanensis CRIB-18]
MQITSLEEKLLLLLQTTQNLIKEGEEEGKKINEFILDSNKLVSSDSPEGSLKNKDIKKIENSENNSLIFWVGLIASVVFPLLFIVNPGLSAIGVLLIGALLIKAYVAKKKPPEATQEL